MHWLAGTLAPRLHAGLPGPHHDHVVAHVQEGVQHASAQALAVGEKQHYRGEAPYDTQHGERRAHAVAHQRLPTLRDEFFRVHTVACGYRVILSEAKDLCILLTARECRDPSLRS